MVLTSDSSSEDDDVYVASASRLKALKKKTVISNDDSPTVPKADSDLSSFDPKASDSSSGSTASYKYNTRTRRCNNPNVQITPVQVILDDDDEIVWENAKGTFNISQQSTEDIEEENYYVDVKVKWKSREIVRLELRKYETFQKVFQHFADLEGVSEKQILILRRDKAVHRTDTPASLDLKVIDILEGGIVSADVMIEEQTEDAEDICKIKVQMSTKQKINVDLKMNEPFKTVVMTCAEQLGVAPSQIKLSFDGDKIAVTDTPESLDLEHEACIDLRVV